MSPTHTARDFIASVRGDNQRPTDALIEDQVLNIDDEYRQELIKAL